MQVQDKVAVITGGASGLGLATAKALLDKGAKVALFDMNPNGQQVADELGDAAIFCQVNVTDEDSVQQGIAKVVDVFSVIHIGVNCAGIAPAEKVLSKRGVHALEAFEKVQAVNLSGTFNVIRLLAEQIATQETLNEEGERGIFVNTASIAAFDGQMGQAAYSASKGGVVGMTLPIARDLARSGIRVNTIAPGLFMTPMFETLADAAKVQLAQDVLFPKRLGDPKDYAALVVHMVENVYFNGETVRLDAGIRMA